jgi:hypothetical protein
MRGLFDFAVIFPNAGPKFTMLSGFAKFGLLLILKNSARKWILCDSLVGIVRSTAISISRWLGPRTIPTPLLPKAVSSGLVPFGASGCLGVI